MKKAFDQTVRDLKREVNKKVLKVPGIEQKILDATSNEPWGPHGSHLAELAQGTRNHHEYQMIMNVIWKRINDTRKNWRHVYKVLTVLEYLVAHGSERVIDEIREHAYQISTLSNFQYIDSGGRDQGSNVRKKSQSLVTLVNDKEKIQEVRQKANVNKDKYPSTFSTSGAYRSSSGYGDRYDDNQSESCYGYRDDDQNGHGRERDYGYRNEARYGRGGDPYNQNADRYGRDNEERYGRDGYREDDYRGRGTDDYQLGPRRSVDIYTDRSFDDDDCYSSRSGGGRADDHSHDDRRLEQHLSEQNVGVPPSYEEATRDARNHILNEMNGETVVLPANRPSSPAAPKAASPTKSTTKGPDHVVSVELSAAPTKEVDAFDEFDPRGSMSAALPAVHSTELDLLGSLSTLDSTTSLALMPMTSATTISEADMLSSSGFGTNFATSSAASTEPSQAGENPFGDTTFNAAPQENFQAQPQNFTPVSSIQPSFGSIGSAEPFPPVAPNVETVPSFDFGDLLGGLSFTPNVVNGQHSTATVAFLAPEMSVALASSDLLDDILPRTDSATTISSQTAHPAAPTIVQTHQMNLLPESGHLTMFPPQAAPTSSQAAQPAAPNIMQLDQLNFLQQPGVSTSAPLPSLAPPISSFATQPAAPCNIQSAQFNLIQQPGVSTPLASQAAATTSFGPPAKFQPTKFESKSTVWADTLSRGLVDLNISGPKTNPLADIGVDFESINRMEKRKEAKNSAVPVTSTVTMGKAMGSGSGIGRAGASSVASPPNPMMGSGIGMGMGMGMGMGGNAGIGMGAGMGMGGGAGVPMGMGGYGGGMNQPPMGMGMGVNMGMGMGQGAPMQPPTGMLPPSASMPGVGYNPMMAMGNYGSQPPYRNS